MVEAHDELLRPDAERLLGAPAREFDVARRRVEAAVAPAKGPRHFRGLAGAHEGVEDEVARVRIEGGETIGDFFGKGARVAQEPRRHGRDVPDVVREFAGKQFVGGNARRGLRLGVALAVDGRARAAKDEHVLGHDVGVEVARIRMLDERAGPAHPGRALVPDDVLVELPAGTHEPRRDVVRHREMLAVVQQGAEHQGQEAARARLRLEPRANRE